MHTSFLPLEVGLYSTCSPRKNSRICESHVVLGTRIFSLANRSTAASRFINVACSVFGRSLALCPWTSGASSQEGSRSWADLPCATATSWTSCVAELDKVGPCSCIFRHACQRIKWWPKARKRTTAHPSIPSHHPSFLLILKTANLMPLVG